MDYHIGFTALGDATRQTILERLRRGPQSVGSLAVGLPVSRPAISQHLKLLKQAGLVSLQTDGTRNLYRLEMRGFTELRDHLVAICAEAEAAHAAEIQRQMEERRYG